MFLEIIADDGRRVLGQWVQRPRLGLHLRLSRQSIQIHQALSAGDAPEATRLISAFLRLADFDPAGLGGVGQMAAWQQIQDLNRLRHLLPFQQWEAPPVDEPPQYDYPGRTWAWWIHKLASRYGWTRAYIMEELYPEEAAAYLQEILVSEHYESEEQRVLSEVAYKYDAQSKTSRYVPAPKPGWMDKKREEQTYRVHKRMIPVGNVIKLDDQIH